MAKLTIDGIKVEVPTPRSVSSQTGTTDGMLWFVRTQTTVERFMAHTLLTINF